MLRGPVLCELEESCLLELFETIAPVRDVRQIKNKLAGGFKDFAFIEFFTPEETSIAYREASDPSFRIAGQRVNANYSRNKSDDDYFKPLPYEVAKRERRTREKPTLENNYYHLQKQKEKEQEKARPAITLEQLKEKHEKELKKHQTAQKEMTEEQSRRRKAEQLSRQWEREMKTQVTMYICAACDRKFQNAEEMKVHEKMSKLHVFNLARLSKACLSL